MPSGLYFFLGLQYFCSRFYQICIIMKKLSIFVAFAAMAVSALFAQDDAAKKSPWSYNGLAGVNYSQSSFTNWSAGGDNSMSGNVYLNASLNYLDENSSWTNDLDANFGMMNSASIGEWRKNIDNLHLASKYGRTMAGKFYYAVLLDMKTQFADGYDYGSADKKKVSSFMTPAYVTLSVGIDYKPNANFSAYYSPVSGKLTYVNDTVFSVAYGLKQGLKTRWELGSTFKANVAYQFWDNKVTLKSNVDLFTAYNESFGNVDVNWDLLLGLNLTKHISLNFQSTLKYDDDIRYIDPTTGESHGARIQFKEVFGLGLTYKF